MLNKIERYILSNTFIYLINNNIDIFFKVQFKSESSNLSITTEEYSGEDTFFPSLHIVSSKQCQLQ